MILGWFASYFAIYYVAVFLAILGVGAVGGIVVATQREPARFAFLMLILGLPIASFRVPPGRFEITIFDLVMVALTIVFFWRKTSISDRSIEPLFPTTSLLFAWLLLIPCVLFSQFPLLSLWRFTETLTVYVFFLFLLAELRREEGFERLVLLLSVVTIVIAIGIVFDRLANVDPTPAFRSTHRLEQFGGLVIRRSSGIFFVDPLKAAQFLACGITFLALLFARNRFIKTTTRVLISIAIVLGFTALFMTVTRAAILACVSVSCLFVVLFNRWGLAAKLVITGFVAFLVLGIAFTPADALLHTLPEALTGRLSYLRESIEGRVRIGSEYWNMFADHPVTGIGLGSFEPYLAATRPFYAHLYTWGPESGYLAILYEGGVAGSGAAALVVGDALRRAITVAASSDSDPNARTETIAALAGLIVFALTFVTLSSLNEERNAAMLGLLLAVIWYHSLRREHHAQKA